MTARTEESEALYQAAKKRGDLESLKDIAPIKEWVHWKLVPNKFPHDKLNTRHLMVVLKRETDPDDYWGLRDVELYELWWDIFPELEKEYHYFKINGSALRSVGNVPHIHVCDFLPEYV